jgi:hypothetical protein
MSGALELADTTPAGVGAFLHRVADRFLGEAVAKATTKSEGDLGDFPASDYAFVPDAEKPSTWKLRLTSSPGGAPDASIVGAAVAALGAGFRGNKVEIPSADLAGVKAKVRTAWMKANPDMKESDMPTAIAKAVTFASIIAGHELSDALPEAFDTLEDAVWSAIYAHDPTTYADLSVDDKQALVAQSLDEFKAYLLGIMASGVGKREISEAARAVARMEAIVAKVGRKISGARLEQLKTAAVALASVLAEVEADPADPAEEDVQKSGAAAEEQEVTSEEFTAAMAPFAERLEAIEKRLPEPAAVVVKTEIDVADDELTLAVVAESIGKLADRLEAVEKARGNRTSADGQDDGQVKKSQWAGIF